MTWVTMELNNQMPPVANLAMGEDFHLDDRNAPNGDAIEIAAHTSIHDFRTKRWPKNAKFGFQEGATLKMDDVEDEETALPTTVMMADEEDDLATEETALQPEATDLGVTNAAVIMSDPSIPPITPVDPAPLAMEDELPPSPPPPPLGYEESDGEATTWEVPTLPARKGGRPETPPTIPSRPRSAEGGGEPDVTSSLLRIPPEKEISAGMPSGGKPVSSPITSRTFQFIMLSAIYAKLLVVICLSIVSAEVITHRVPLYYHEGFFTYLYGISILFLLYAYTFLLRSTSRRNSLSRKEPLLQGSPLKGEAKDDLEGANQLTARKKRRILETRPQHGSIFLRIGAIAFGLGAMIYIGLELGSFFEIPSTSPCYDLMRGLNPILQVVFTFAQMYFIFMNSRLNIHKFKACARFGLMHVVATNICVWIRTVVRESMKDMVAYGEGDMSEWHEDATMLRHIGNLTGNATSCQRQDIMGTIVADSAPYLYPFIYQYCLIAAAVIYVMWRNIGRARAAAETELSADSPSPDKQEMMAAGNSSKVDCVGSSKGLFFGLFVLVAATISLILFFVLVGHERFKRLSLFFADVSECSVMALSLLAMMLGFARVQALRFCSDRDDVLSDLLLRVATFGVYLYSMFGLIAGAMSALSSEPNLLVMVTCALTILQVTIQTLFVSDVSHRASYLVDHERTKPGRQVVTFLLICNLTLWIIETFEMQRVQVNPVQLDFYGNLAWASIQRISLPLTIFYRFHSSVMLAEVWKNAYRLHPN